MYDNLTRINGLRGQEILASSEVNNLLENVDEFNAEELHYFLEYLNLVHCSVLNYLEEVELLLIPISKNAETREHCKNCSLKDVQCKFYFSEERKLNTDNNIVKNLTEYVKTFKKVGKTLQKNYI